MATLALEGNTLHVTHGPPPARTVSLPLDALRLACLFVPRQRRPRFPQTGDPQDPVDLHELSDGQVARVREELAAAGAGQCALFLEDYAGRYATIPWPDVEQSGVDLLAELARRRQTHRDRRAEWTRNAPGLILTGVSGDKATFDGQGVRAGARRFLAWEDLDRAEIRPGPKENTRACHFIPRPESRRRPFAVRIPDGKADLFLAECAFWRALAREQAQRPV